MSKIRNDTGVNVVIRDCVSATVVIDIFFGVNRNDNFTVWYVAISITQVKRAKFDVRSVLRVILKSSIVSEEISGQINNRDKLDLQWLGGIMLGLEGQMLVANHWRWNGILLLCIHHLWLVLLHLSHTRDLLADTVNVLPYVFVESIPQEDWDLKELIMLWILRRKACKFV